MYDSVLYFNVTTSVFPVIKKQNDWYWVAYCSVYKKITLMEKGWGEKKRMIVYLIYQWKGKK